MPVPPIRAGRCTLRRVARLRAQKGPRFSFLARSCALVLASSSATAAAMKDAGKSNPTKDAQKFMHLKHSYPETWKKLVSSQNAEDDAWGINKQKEPAIVLPEPKVLTAEEEKEKAVETKLEKLMHMGVNNRRTPCGSFFST